MGSRIALKPSWCTGGVFVGREVAGVFLSDGIPNIDGGFFLLGS